MSMKQNWSPVAIGVAGLVGAVASSVATTEKLALPPMVCGVLGILTAFIVIYAVLVHTNST